MRRTALLIAVLLTSSLIVTPLANAATVAEYFTQVSQKRATFYPTVRDGYLDDTTLSWRLPSADGDQVSAVIKNSRGRVIADDSARSVWLSAHRTRGSVTWDGRDSARRQVPVGSYRWLVVVTDRDGRRHRLSRQVRVATGTRWVNRSHSVEGSDFVAQRKTRSCYVRRDRYFGKGAVDCWGGRYAQITYRLPLRYELGVRNVRWTVSGRRWCCGPISKTAVRRGHRLVVTVRATDWSWYTVNRVRVTYQAKVRT